MSKNPHGGISRKSASREWGSKARKHETTDRNLNRRAADEAIREQLAPPVEPTQTWAEIDGDWVADILENA